MTKLPTITIDPLCLSDLFFNFAGLRFDLGEDDPKAAAYEFIQLAGVENQVTVEELVQDFKRRE